MGFARLAESSIKKLKGKGENEKLTPLEKIASSSIGGALATWNQPIEVVRVEVGSSLSLPVDILYIIMVDRCNLWQSQPVQTPSVLKMLLSSVLSSTSTERTD